MTNFIDRRLNSKNKSTVNRRRFLRRYHQQIKKSLGDAIGQRSVTDVDSGEDVSIPRKDISEPEFRQGPGGIRDQVHPGNDQFSQGDRIARPNTPQQGQGQGSDASDSGEGEDDFVFHLSRDEYLDLLFEDLALPNLKQTPQSQIVKYQVTRAGFKTSGNPSSIDIVRSFKNSYARRIASSGHLRKTQAKLQQQLKAAENAKLKDPELIKKLTQELDEINKKLKTIPWFDEFDLRYKNYQNTPITSSKAVMFCLMDVSGSMDQATKEIAKRFYILLYLFLTRNYKDVDVIYIRHHTQAKEVDEETFFYSTETGGTIVSSALELMADIQKKRYPSEQWNIYAAQASDGDNWAEDSPTCVKLLQESLLPVTRYFSYIEITQRPHQTLWHEYQKMSETKENFAIQHIRTADDIIPVFRQLFKKQHVA